MRPHLLLLEVHVLQDRRAAGGVAAGAAQVGRVALALAEGAQGASQALHVLLGAGHDQLDDQQTHNGEHPEGAFGRRRGSSRRRVAPAAELLVFHRPIVTKYTRLDALPVLSRQSPCTRSPSTGWQPRGRLAEYPWADPRRALLCWGLLCWGLLCWRCVCVSSFPDPGVPMVTAILTLAKFLMTWALDLLAYLRTYE